MQIVFAVTFDEFIGPLISFFFPLVVAIPVSQCGSDQQFPPTLQNETMDLNSSQYVSAVFVPTIYYLSRSSI